MRDVLKRLLIVFTVAIVIILAYLVSYSMQQKEQVDLKANNTNNTVVTSQNTTDVNNSEVNTPKEEKQEEPAKKEEKQEEINKTEDIGKEEVSVNEEDKAIDLAKKKYGSTDGVYFRIEQIKANGVYIVSVRNSETTRDIAWYTVDVNAGTVQ